MELQGNITCPNCGAPNKYPNKTVMATEFNYPRHRPVIFTCGTVMSKDWSPPIYGKDCHSK